MKKLVLAAAFATAASSAFAGGMDAPMMEAPMMAPEVIVEQVAEATNSSSGGFIVPLILVALLAVASQ